MLANIAAMQDMLAETLSFAAGAASLEAPGRSTWRQCSISLLVTKLPHAADGP